MAVSKLMQMSWKELHSCLPETFTLDENQMQYNSCEGPTNAQATLRLFGHTINERDYLVFDF